MFYLYNGAVCVTPVGQTVDEYVVLKKYCLEKCGNDKLFIDICKYIFFVYHKVDSLGNKNLFNAYPIVERREAVVETYGLFDGHKHPNDSKKIFKAEDIYTFKESKALLSFFKFSTHTENERTLEVFREKINHWREKYSNIQNTPEEDKEFADALFLAEKAYKEYQTKILIDVASEAEAVEGLPLFLFEIPENQKPMHVRLQYGDLKK